MQAKGWVILKVLLNRFHQGEEATFLEGMNQQDRQNVLAQKINSKDLNPLSLNYDKGLSRIHYSWIASKISKDDPIISLIPESLAKRLGYEPSPLKIPAKFKGYLFQQLYPKLEIENVKPVEYLLPCPLSPLLNLKKPELVHLIDFLGIYDLSEEVKRIIDKKKLTQIYETLTPKKHDFLRHCMHLRDKLVTPRMNLEHWNGEHDKLNKVLYERGLIRLGYALSGNEPDFIWHIVHTLDAGRGTDLMRHVNKQEISGVTGSVTIQVLNTIKFLKEL